MRPDSFCYSSCLARYFQDSVTKMCVSCSYDCYSCSSNGLCTACNATADFRELSQTTLRCVPLAGYYEAFATISVACSSGCSKCSSASLCTACQSGFLLSPSRLCVTSCPARSLADTSGECLKCPYDCLTCNALGECLTCSTADFRSLNSLIKRCLPLSGYFDSLATAATACSSGCSSCQSLQLCTSCLSGYFLHTDGLCYITCPSKYIGVSSTQRYTKCPYDCLICNQAGQCLSCDSSFSFRSLFSATLRCPPLAITTARAR
jgi:proprotein convertase subtilisin/kexin type 5